MKLKNQRPGSKGAAEPVKKIKKGKVLPVHYAMKAYGGVDV
jgi:hypothetical protein